MAVAAHEEGQILRKTSPRRAPALRNRVTTLLTRSLACPLCQTVFDATSMGSSNTMGPLTSDLRRHAAGADPLPWLITSCPACGWTAGEGGWGELPSLANREVEAGVTLVQRVREALGEGTTGKDAALRYEAGAKCAAWAGFGPLREGDCWLRAAWMHGDQGRPEDERRCRESAVEAYARALRDPDSFRKRQDLVVICYLSGELHRRLGREEAARNGFEQAIRWSAGRSELAGLVALARRQMEAPEEFVGEG